MRLKNTSRYPDAEVRALVEFGTRGVNMAGVAVHVKNALRIGHDYSGRAYPQVPSCSPRAGQKTVRHLITVKLGRETEFPTVNHYSKRLKSVPEQEIRDWREALVRVAAHEARHIHQFRHKRPLSEVDCERFAAKRLEEWKEGQR